MASRSSSKSDEEFVRGVGGAPISDEDFLKNIGGEPLVDVRGHTRAIRRAASRAKVPVVTPFGIFQAPGLGASLEAAPTALGTAGQFLGGGAGPASIGLSALGGSLGQGIKQAGEAVLGTEETNPEFKDRIKRIAGSGLEQGAYTAAGGVLAKGLGLAGKAATRVALKLSPEAAQVAIREGITATRAGLDKAFAKLTAQGYAVRLLADEATKAGQRFPKTDAVLNVSRKLIQEVDKLPDPVAAKEWLRRKTIRVIGSHGDSWTPNQVLNFKRSADEAASKFYRATEQGKIPPSAVSDIEELWHKTFADEMRSLLETIPNKRAFPWSNGVEVTIPEINARSSELIGVKNAVSRVLRKGKGFAERATAPTIRSAAGAAVGTLAPGNDYRNAAAGAVLGAGLGSPGALSSFGLLSASPVLGPLIANLLRGSGVAIQSSNQ